MAGLVVVCQEVAPPGGEPGGCHPHGVAPPPITPLAGVGAPWRPLADFDVPGILPRPFRSMMTKPTACGRRSPVG